MWKFILVDKKVKIKDPILVAGLPGIGNVGKITVDFLVDNLKAKMLYEISSNTLPNSVFVTEDNLVELISISIYHKKIKDKDLLFLVGDVQPTDEIPSYEFCEEILKILKSKGCKEIITLGGIGLAEIPKKPKIYITGNSKKMINKYMKDTKMDNKIYGIVGPIIGVSGLLIGMSQKKNIGAICILAETFGHPMFLGVTGGRAILKALNSKLNLNLDFKVMDKEIKNLEKEILRKVSEIEDMTSKKGKGDLINYIG